MKTHKYLFILLTVLILLAAFLVLKNQMGNIPAGMKNVAVENTDEIDRITIWCGTDTIILDKQDQEWRLNNQFAVKKDAIVLVLNMLKRFEIASPVPRNYQNIAVKKLENYGKHVQLYKGKQIIRSFFIDHDTTEIQGTLYLKEGSHTPFMLKLKGYSLSDISLLFSPHIRFWRENIIFRYQPSEISGIRILYPGNPSQSFELDLRIKNLPRLVRISNGEEIHDFDYKNVTDYLYYFSGVAYRPLETDRLPAATAGSYFADITITDDSENDIRLKLYRKVRDDNTGSTPDYDLYRCYGKISDEPEFISIQYEDIDPILKELDDFLKK